MAKGNSFKSGNTDTGGARRAKSTTSSYTPKKTTRTFRKIDFTEGQQKVMKVFGLFLLITSGLFAVAFISYLFTWKADQSYIYVTNGGWNTLFSSSEEVLDEALEIPVIENKLGKFGALLANQFIFEWFGVASFLFILILFVVGYRLLYLRSLLPVGKTILYSLIAIIFTSLTLGFLQDFITDTPHILEGKFGYWTNQILTLQIGTAGVAGILIFVLLAALILIYNYDLKISFQSARSPEEEAYDDGEETDDDLDNERLDRPTATNSFIEDRSISRERIVQQPRANAVEKDSLEQHQQENPTWEPELSTPKEKNTLRSEAQSGTISFDVVDTHTPEPTIPATNEADAIALSVEPDLSFEIEEADDEELALTVEAVKEEKAVEASDLVKQFGEYDPKLDLSGYQHPPLDLLKDYGTGKITINQQELEANKNKIVDTLRNYSIEIEHIKATIGPTVTLYEIIPKPGVRISRIKNLEDDIALSLAALGIRIIAPMPGKGTIGIEVPNSNPEMVSMRSVIATEKFQKTDMDLPIALGKTISNEVYIADLAKMPHLLVAGATGQGKSVGINAILTSLLYKRHPAELKFVLVDPKKVELSLFKKIERHFLAKLPGEDDAIITDTKKVINTLNSLCIEMDQRYDLLKNGHVRNLKEYNAKFVGRRLNPEEGHRFLPFIVLIVDEFADLMMTAGKEVETPIARLAQLARAVGIHLVIATQRPSVNIITGTIKANFPARLAFRVLSKVDSRTILDSGGADQLIGRGDMLLATGSELIRIQCAFVDTPEVDQVSDFIGGQRGYPSAHYLPEYVDENGEGSGLADFDLSDRDALFEDAARLIVMHQQGSTSLIQRKLKLGYNRAGRIIDQLEAAGIVGQFEGSKAREVLYPDEYSLEQYLETLR
ncbi:DNA translocase FtsK [Sphingobacterium corticibacter]|uniref:Cell division protein FtsK n=1 Tax=Sphingobacterium corticibacter TaxID=2171749 RepID=A0A2T8HHL5_9SPHI|nr:DNA translocase FtsK [Sphingobacterium corticibacter]PVH24893.1 cell division protein FtsK [Sphingobacterium corticibacter]